MPRIKVTSTSFSQNPLLAQELRAVFPDAVLNEEGRRLAGPDLAAFLADADGAVIGLEKVDSALLDACPRLKIVAKYGVGLDNIDIPKCQDRGVAIGWTGGVNRRSVGELALCFMLGLCRNVFRTSTLMRGGVWEKNGGVQLSGKTVGIIGLGHTGREVARLLEPLHCRVLANDILDMGDYCRDNGIIPAGKEQIFAEADVLTLHVPCTPLTTRLVNADTLRAMKPSAVLINTCRGEVVDQEALKAALKQGTIAAAAIDVYEEEPPTDMELLLLPNLVCTAHIGGNAHEAVVAMGRSAIGHLTDYFG
ncbi:hydroxyacid dehydrogenase [Magnetospirillum sp. ME-1]|uniref:phosphoglycerate dehydrogenase n=1 Tax=Magnetospirillum sp. ME-1 TaxID=1639348 RepID=UPI000A17AC2B|nr:phosphoglycerate dehydrogenase [Magnetospirillum sp. ME-1]ARJ67210.1 hydroxyacid dehydrogenase [Magnetospirillum sp. ME-1]